MTKTVTIFGVPVEVKTNKRKKMQTYAYKGRSISMRLNTPPWTMRRAVKELIDSANAA